MRWPLLLAAAAVLVAGCNSEETTNLPWDTTVVVEISPAMKWPGGWGSAIRKALQPLPGVASVKVDSQTQVTLKVEAQKFDKTKVEDALKTAGYGESKVRG